MPLEHDERRSQQRVPVQLRTVYHDEIDPELSDGLMSNLSLGGCFIRTKRPLENGAKVRLKFKLAEGEPPIEAAGLVRWGCRGKGDEDGMGIQFEEISATDLNLLKRFVEARIQELLFS
jgi:uncharacterized protein (TIGR02266 family)